MLRVIKTSKIIRCCLEYLSLPLLGFVMMVNSGQGCACENIIRMLYQRQLPAHSVLQPNKDDADLTLAAGSTGAGSRVRPLGLPEVQK